ncbi:hypothetical protein GWK47_044363 [Chionoecetes opilio]|uniref:Uncharacterized protein n=1 Tax=Chionoecetes opilio TaxID=41210 RepID=A0A8J5CIM9_CHIOP|nr:hypothetical protein GWK47_044363 [Chionoecetes opilio]
MAYKFYSTSVSLSESHSPSLLSLLKTASRNCMFPLVKTSFSNLSLVMLARLGLRTSPAVLNMRSTAAELGKAVLYLMNSEIHFSLCMLGNCPGFTSATLLLPQVSTSFLMSSPMLDPSSSMTVGLSRKANGSSLASLGFSVTMSWLWLEGRGSGVMEVTISLMSLSLMSSSRAGATCFNMKGPWLGSCRVWLLPLFRGSEIAGAAPFVTRVLFISHHLIPVYPLCHVVHSSSCVSSCPVCIHRLIMFGVLVAASNSQYSVSVIARSGDELCLEACLAGGRRDGRREAGRATGNAPLYLDEAKNRSQSLLEQCNWWFRLIRV